MDHGRRGHSHEAVEVIWDQILKEAREGLYIYPKSLKKPLRGLVVRFGSFKDLLRSCVARG